MAEKFDQWGIVELMGHQRTAGRLSEEMIAGANLLRVDVPNGETFRTAYYGPNAIYALHVTGEAEARKVAEAFGPRPPFAYVMEQRLPAIGSSRPEDDQEDAPEF